MTTADQELKNAERWGKGDNEAFNDFKDYSLEELGQLLRFTCETTDCNKSDKAFVRNVCNEIAKRKKDEEYEAELLRVDNGNGGS